MIAFLIVVAIINLGLGFVLGWYRVFGNGPAASNALAEAETAAQAAAAESARSSEFLNRLHELAANVQELAGRHTTRLGEITDELSETGENSDAAAVLAAATALIKANRQLEDELANTKQEIEIQQQQLESTIAVSRTDPLTGIANRRAYDAAIEEQFREFQEQGTTFGLIMLDVDHFKKFNDEHGHQAGDEVLRGVAEVLKATMRTTDVVARFGGEEFCALLPATNIEETKVAAERLRAAIAEARFEFEGKQLQVTASVGAATAIESDTTDLLLKRADEALYDAKKNGRNRAYFHNGTTTEPIDVTIRDSRRFAFNSVQRVAPYNGVLPSSSKFVEVECEDLSSTGFAFLIPHKPSYQQVAVAFGSPSDPFYRIASIRNITDVGTPTNHMYRVGCVFTDRITLGDQVDDPSMEMPAAAIA